MFAPITQEARAQTLNNQTRIVLHDQLLRRNRND
jgi:hypothetical protein